MCRGAKNSFRIRLSILQGDASNVEFARICGLNTQDIQRYSRGLAYPTIDKLVQIASAFSVSTDWLLGLSDTKTCSQTPIGMKEKILSLKDAATHVCAAADALLESIVKLEEASK